MMPTASPSTFLPSYFLLGFHGQHKQNSVDTILAMPSMKTTVDAVKEAGLSEQVKTMVGGAPLTEAYAEQIGADGYAPDAASAAEKAKELVDAMQG